ncbi:transposase [Streptomyces sp. NPDC058620]|uniref:transposase n=1 Tax=Streptomyces sp. NPDC058620 TaxID=3346560 RepID=UPI003652B268
MVLNSQTVRASVHAPKETTGLDPGKKSPDRKPGIATDVLGLVIAVVVVAASVHDNAIGIALLDKTAAAPTVTKAWRDAGFKNGVVEHAARLGIDVEIVRATRRRRTHPGTPEHTHEIVLELTSEDGRSARATATRLPRNPHPLRTGGRRTTRQGRLPRARYRTGVTTHRRHPRQAETPGQPRHPHRAARVVGYVAGDSLVSDAGQGVFCYPIRVTRLRLAIADQGVVVMRPASAGG